MKWIRTGGTGMRILRWLKKNLSTSGKPCRGARLTNCGAKGASEVTRTNQERLAAITLMPG